MRITGDITLIAPCGMHCAVCSGYLAYLNQIPRKRGKIAHCAGCRPRDKQCAYLKGHCGRLKRKGLQFCFQCPEYPCKRLLHIDERYRNNYGMSFIENLEDIRRNGVEIFLKHQRKRFSCPTCKGWLSVHNKKCFACDTVNSWKD